MSREEHINIIVAETSPIISTGLIACLRRLNGINTHIYEAHNHNELLSTVRTCNYPVVIVNPTFGGSFVPGNFRIAADSDIKIIAIEIGHIDRSVRSLYDETISVTDDIASLSEKIKNLVNNSPTETTANKDTLSQREKEIVQLVVKGLTNKEIADKLFLSIHTVITHRRNISRKLEIHSATGLTIYAIVNQLVNIEDIKI